MHAAKEIRCSELEEVMMSLVKKAKGEICETFQTANEIKKSPPSEYFKLLDEKSKGGVWVLRLGFGNNDEFSELVDQYPGVSPSTSGYSREPPSVKKCFSLITRICFFAPLKMTSKNTF